MKKRPIRFVKQIFAIKDIKQMNALERALQEIKSFKRSDAVSLETALTRIGD
jgi:hypothetical protein